MSQYLCPVCRAPMKRDLKARISLLRHFQILLLTISLVGLAYLVIGPYAAMKASIVYLPIWAIFEFLHWVQMREALNCKVCDFDPMLYQRDWKRARARIEQKMTKVHDNLELEIKARIDRVKAARPSQTTREVPSENLPKTESGTATVKAADSTQKTLKNVAKPLNSID
jgi:hypothetical protein